MTLSGRSLPALVVALLLSSCGDPAKTLLSISVTLQDTQSANLLPSRTSQGTATGLYSDGTSTDITLEATWSTSNGAIATVNSSTGLVTGIATGTVSILATFDDVEGSTEITVVPIILTSIHITAPSTTLPNGMFLQLTATGSFNDGTTADITPLCDWSSNMTGIATIDPLGEVEGQGIGDATLACFEAGVSDTFDIDVTDEVLETITVSPVTVGEEVMPRGRNIPFRAIGLFSAGTSNDVTNLATWSSGNTSIATVDNATNKGLVTFEAIGTTMITATISPISDSTSVTVLDAVVDSIAVTPATPTLPLGLDLQFVCTATLSDLTVDDCTPDCAWTSSDTNLATIDATGLATANDATTGTTNIDCDYLTFTDDVDLVVNPAVLESIEVFPPTATLVAQFNQQYTATGTYSNGQQLDITNSVSWTAAPSSFISVSSTGDADLMAGAPAGACTITATQGLISDSSDCTISTATLVSIDVGPDAFAMPVGTPQQYTAIGTLSDSSLYVITADATWSSTNTNVATVSNAPGTRGQVTGVTPGTTSISATVGTISDSVPLTISPPPLVSIIIECGTTPLLVGQQRSCSALGTFSDNSTSDITQASQIAWTSSAPTFVTVSNADGTRGQLTGVAPGTSNISAMYTDVTVVNSNLVSVQINPAPTPEIEFRLMGSPFGSGGMNNLGSNLAPNVAIPFTFTIHNTGAGNLVLGTTTFTSETNCAGAFTTPAPVSPVLPGTNTTITGTITPAGGSFNCTFSTPSNDNTGSENPYVVVLTGSASIPIGNFTTSTWVSDNGCGIDGFQMNVSPSTGILVDGFGSNPNGTDFILTGNPNVAERFTLFIFGVPLHFCRLTLLSGFSMTIFCQDTQSSNTCTESASKL